MSSARSGPRSRAVRRGQRFLDRAVNRALWLAARDVPTAVAPEEAWSVLFVCLGNVCRSPLAEEILRSKLAAAGVGKLVNVDSAGTSAYNVGRPPDWRAQLCARRHGLSIGRQRARRLAPDDLAHFDQVVVMDSEVMEGVRRIARGTGGRAHIVPIAAYGGSEIPDPVEKGLAEFEAVYADLDRVCALIADDVVRRLARMGVTTP